MNFLTDAIFFYMHNDKIHQNLLCNLQVATLINYVQLQTFVINVGCLYKQESEYVAWNFYQWFTCLIQPLVY